MTTKRKAIAMLSGGLDSLVAMAAILDKADVICALTFSYGQHAVTREIEAAQSIAAHYRVEHEVIMLPVWERLPGIPLVSPSYSVPRVNAEAVQARQSSQEIARTLWVPNRNAVFVNVAAAHAEARKADIVVTGFNREEGESFPDNSADFINAINESLRFSTMTDVCVESPTISLDKKQIVELGLKLSAPLHMIHSCYLDAKKMCGDCPSCQRIKHAFRKTHAFNLIQHRFDNET